MAATPLKSALEDLLKAHRLQAEGPPLRGERRLSPLPTGIGPVDERMGGGLPRGQVSEVHGPASSGRTAVALAAVAGAVRRGALAAWIDPGDRFDPDVFRHAIASSAHRTEAAQRIDLFVHVDAFLEITVVAPGEAASARARHPGWPGRGAVPCRRFRGENFGVRRLDDALAGAVVDQERLTGSAVYPPNGGMRRKPARSYIAIAAC